MLNLVQDDATSRGELESQAATLMEVLVPASTVGQEPVSQFLLPGAPGSPG